MILLLLISFININIISPDCGVIEDIIYGLVDVLANVPVRYF